MILLQIYVESMKNVIYNLGLCQEHIDHYQLSLL